MFRCEKRRRVAFAFRCENVLVGGARKPRMLLLIALISCLCCIVASTTRASAACGLEVQKGVAEKLAAVRANDPISKQSAELQIADSKLKSGLPTCSDYDEATALRSEGSRRVLDAWEHALLVREARSIEGDASAECRVVLREYDRYELMDSWTRYFGAHWNQRGSSDSGPVILGAVAAQRDRKFAHVAALIAAEAKAFHVSLPPVNAPESVIDGALDRSNNVAYAAEEHASTGHDLGTCQFDALRVVHMEYISMRPYFLSLSPILQ